MAKSAKPALDPLVIGIDIGGTGTKFGIVDRVGNVLFSSEGNITFCSVGCDFEV